MDPTQAMAKVVTEFKATMDVHIESPSLSPACRETLAQARAGFGTTFLLLARGRPEEAGMGLSSSGGMFTLAAILDAGAKPVLDAYVDTMREMLQIARTSKPEDWKDDDPKQQ